MRKFSLQVLGLIVGLMSGILSIGREVLGFFYPQHFPESRLLSVSLNTAVFVSCALVYWQEHKKLLAEQKRNTGSRIEGQIRETFIDSKRNSDTGRFEVISSGAYITLFITATNLNPASAHLDPFTINMEIKIEGHTYSGKYQRLPTQFVEYFAQSNLISNGVVFDFFNAHFGPLTDGEQGVGCLRFCCEQLNEATLKKQGPELCSVKLSIADSRNKVHTIEGTLPLQFDKMKHHSEFPPPV